MKARKIAERVKKLSTLTRNDSLVNLDIFKIIQLWRSNLTVILIEVQMVINFEIFASVSYAIALILLVGGKAERAAIAKVVEG